MMMQGAGDRSAVPRCQTGNKNLFRFLVTVTAVSRGCHVAALWSRDQRLLRAAMNSMALVEVAVITSSVLHTSTWIFSSSLRADFVLLCRECDLR